MEPEETLDFISLPNFEKRWEKLRLSEKDLEALKVLLMTNPAGSPVIQGTGGIRKMRFSSKSWKSGLRGGVRVLYKHFEGLGIVLLCLVYAKNESDNISAAVRNHLRKTVKEIEKELERKQRL